MSLMINGTTVPTSGNYVKYGNTNLDKVICNGKEVWKKIVEKSMLMSGWSHIRSCQSADGSIMNVSDPDVTLVCNTTRVRCEITGYNEIPGYTHWAGEDGGIHFWYDIWSPVVDMTPYTKLSIIGSVFKNTGNIYGGNYGGYISIGSHSIYAPQNNRDSNNQWRENINTTVDISGFTGNQSIHIHMMQNAGTHNIGAYYDLTKLLLSA